MRTLTTLTLLLAGTAGSYATQTENLRFRVLPAAGKIIVDGKTDDWDLSAGIFAGDDVEEQRDRLAVWLHGQYDAECLYVLARWSDETPLNNPGQTIADYGFAGDCLQFRTITAAGTPQERGQHFTAWRGRDGADVIKVEQGTNFKEGVIVDAKKSDGARQAFTVNADGKGYVQEIAIPWKRLTRDGQPLKAGDSFTLTFEPNFTVGANGRLSVKDLFKPGVTPDRVFTFMAARCWGTATLEPNRGVAPQPVRLADARELPVKLEEGVPVVDWSGLVPTKDMPGFMTIAFTMPEDGYLSLNIKDPQGQVVRQLVNGVFFAKGRHEVKWDGLTTRNWRTPGEPVPAGQYTWEALWHKGIGLRLRGWACNAGNAPWDSSPTSNWGGDHGVPVACAADADRVYLGWSGAEAGKALVACDRQGRVLWKNSRAGMAGAELVAVDQGIVFAQHWGGTIYRLDAQTGSYSKWAGPDNAADVFVKSLWGDAKDMPEKADAMEAHGGRLYLGFARANLIAVLDGQSGKLLKKLAVKSPTDAKARADGKLLVVSDGSTVLVLNPDNGQASPLIANLSNARALAVDRDGAIYVGLREPANQVIVFDAGGKKLRDIGRPGGRARLGKWPPDGLAFIQGLTVDADEQLWVAEADMHPKRFSVWDTKTGRLVQEFFGPSTYGALGGAINPLDPDLMVGQGCEWRLDPKTGLAPCLGVITRDGMENARFGVGSNGKPYLAVATRWTFDLGDVNLFERIGDGDYRLRTKIFYVDTEGRDIPPPAHGQTGTAAKTAVWSDENGDGQRQPNEVTMVDGIIRVTGWYMPMTPDLTLHGGDKRFPVVGFTGCGAPKYDFAHPVKMPIAGWASTDGRYVLGNGEYGVNNSWNRCFDLATGKLRWTYPDNFVGVHGSHNACPPEPGMIRGSFGPTGTAKLPAPLGNVWVIPTNVGEWHLLTEDGFYLGKLFEGDPLKVQWPERAVPGVDMSRTPPGMGGEDFGGSIAQGKDGKLYVQAGKTGFWNLEVTGLDTVRAMPGTNVALSEQDVKTAGALREQQMQAAVGTRRTTAKKMTPKFTGNLDADFRGAEMMKFQKQDDAAVRAAIAWDDGNLYLAWEVHDATPWTNGAEAEEELYRSGDTVDFQLGADAQADAKRAKAAAGDLRLSIGNFKGRPTAVLYREVWPHKQPKTFSSGVVKQFQVDSVTVPSGIAATVKPHGNRCVVEVAIPLAALALQPRDGLTLRGDFGVTHGDSAGKRTRLRTYWSNQHTGLVDDAVFELLLEPRHWGEITFR